MRGSSLNLSVTRFLQFYPFNRNQPFRMHNGRPASHSHLCYQPCDSLLTISSPPVSLPLSDLTLLPSRSCQITNRTGCLFAALKSCTGSLPPARKQSRPFSTANTLRPGQGLVPISAFPPAATYQQLPKRVWCSCLWASHTPSPSDRASSRSSFHLRGPLPNSWGGSGRGQGPETSPEPIKNLGLVLQGTRGLF